MSHGNQAPGDHEGKEACGKPGLVSPVITPIPEVVGWTAKTVQNLRVESVCMSVKMHLFCFGGTSATDTKLF